LGGASAYFRDERQQFIKTSITTGKRPLLRRKMKPRKIDLNQHIAKYDMLIAPWL
jgi:hypothetical protein